MRQPDRIDDPQIGISIRLIRKWKPEPVEVEAERAAKSVLRYLGVISSHDWEQRTGDETV